MGKDVSLPQNIEREVLGKAREFGISTSQVVLKLTYGDILTWLSKEQGDDLLRCDEGTMKGILISKLLRIYPAIRESVSVRNDL